MTGEKNRFKTSEQLWKFQDETLTTPAHDELICYLLDNHTILQKIPALAYGGVDCGAILSREYGFKFESYNVTDIYAKCYTEIPITNGINNFIIGYWDLVVNIYFDAQIKDTSKRYNYTGPVFVERLIGATDEECNQFFRVKFGKTSVEGVFNILQKIQVSKDNFPKCLGCNEMKNLFMKRLYIEVKPKIASFGNTIRQLRTYQMYTNDAIDATILFTPDLRFKPQFESQGIKVISPGEINHDL